MIMTMEKDRHLVAPRRLGEEGRWCGCRWMIMIMWMIRWIRWIRWMIMTMEKERLPGG